MDYYPGWDRAMLQPVVILGLTLIGLVAYWIIIKSNSLELKFKKYLGEERFLVEWIMFWRYTGFFFFGFIPAVVLFILFPHNAAYYGLGFSNLPESLLWAAIIGGICVPVQSKASRKPAITIQYPQIRAKLWSRRLIIKNFLGWIIYLIAYEFMFRGLLLFGLQEFFGVWPSIMLSTLIYSVSHIPKGKNETLATIPFGIILGYLTIVTGTIWLAFFVHLIFASSNDYFAFSANKNMSLKK